MSRLEFMRELDRLFGNPLFLPRFSQKLADYKHALSSYSSFVASRRHHDSMNPFLLAENRHPPPPRPRPRSPVQEIARVAVAVVDIDPPSIASSAAADCYSAGSASSSPSDSAVVDTDHQEAEPNTLDWSQIENAEQEPIEYSQSQGINHDDYEGKGDHDDGASAASLEASSSDVQRHSLCVLQHMNIAAEIDVKHSVETKRNRSHDDDDDGASHPSSPSRSSSSTSPPSSKRQRLSPSCASSSIIADESDSSAHPLSQSVDVLVSSLSASSSSSSAFLPLSVSPLFRLVCIETKPGDTTCPTCRSMHQGGEVHLCESMMATSSSSSSSSFTPCPQCSSSASSSSSPTAVDSMQLAAPTPSSFAFLATQLFPPFAHTSPDPSPTVSTPQSPLLRRLPNVNNIATSVDSSSPPSPSFDTPPPFVPPAKRLVGVETNPGDRTRLTFGVTYQDGEAHQCAKCIRARLSANHHLTGSGEDDSIQPGSRIFLTSKGGVAMDVCYETALLPSNVCVCDSSQFRRPSSSSSSPPALASTTVMLSSSRFPPSSAASSLLSSSTPMIINAVSSASIASDLRSMGIVRSDADVQQAMRKCPRGDNQMIIDQLMMDRDSEDVDEEQAEEEEGGGEQSQEHQEEEREVEEELEEEEDGEEEEDYRWRANVGRNRVMQSTRKSGSSIPFSNVRASDDEAEDEQSAEDSNDEDYSEEQLVRKKTKNAKKMMKTNAR